MKFKHLIPAILLVAIFPISFLYYQFNKDIIEQAKQAVVVITSERIPSPTEMLENPDKKRFSIGTGFIFEEGLILTNYHVGGESNKVLQIMTENSTEAFEAKSLGGDKASDIGLAKISDWQNFLKKNPKTNTLKISDIESKTGDNIWVIGHPWSLFYSVSFGIISHEKRKAPWGGPLWWYQTDAHVYQGNSGGPWIDSTGQVVAISSRMLSQEGGSYGLGIPATLVKKVMQDLIKYGEVRWAYLGIEIKSPGATISSMEPNGAAQRMGLKNEDQILALVVKENIVKTNNFYDLSIELAKIDYQDISKIIILRDGKKMEIPFKMSYKLLAELEGVATPGMDESEIPPVIPGKDFMLPIR